MGSEDLTSPLQASHEARRSMGGLQETDCTIVTNELEKDGFAAADRKTASKVWTTVTWAVYEGDVPTMGSSFNSGAENDRVVEKARPPGAWHGARQTLHDGSMKSGSTTEEYNGTHRWQSGPAKGMTG